MHTRAFVPLALAALLSAGCGVYLHDAKNQTQAESALKDFQTFRDKSGNPYTVMLKNLEKAKGATADAQRAASDRHVIGYALGVPYKTWAELKEEVAKQIKGLDEAAEQNDRQISELADDLKVAKAAQPDAKATLAAAKKALAEQFNRNQRWVAQQALFKLAIQKVAELSTDTKSDVTLGTLAKTRDELLDSEVTVLEQDAKGDVKSVKKKIRDVIGLDFALPKDPKGFGDLVKGLANVKLETESPGIAVTILGLAVDLSDVEYRKGQARIAGLQRRTEMLEALKQNIDVSRSDLKTAADDLETFPEKELILTHLENRRAAKSAEDVGAALRTLARTAIPATVLTSERLRLQVELATLEHEYSIQVSSLNAQAHEALIGRGLEGLAAYHRGGVTQEEIANFIRAAQAIAVGVIGGLL